MSDRDENGRYEGDEDEKRDAWEAKRARNSWKCKCGYPDWPGTCPGPRNCPLQQEEYHD